MKQSEYIRELKENLETQVTQEELKDILSDYESFFISGKEDGKTDDEISNELGSPAFLAKSLLEEHTDKESKPLDKHIANPGRRMCAYLIDTIIAVMPALILSFFIGTIALPFILTVYSPSPVIGAFGYMSYAAFSTAKEISVSEINEIGEKIITAEHSISGRKPHPVTSIIATLSLAFYLFYSIVCTLLFRGQTLGKKLLHIKVRRSNTERVTFGAIFCREFLGKMLINSIPIIPLASFFTILFTKEHKALHDMLGNTIVSDV